MPVSGLHRQVASIALAAAAKHGFALGGGNALLAHGVTTRPTQDVDLFTDQDTVSRRQRLRSRQPSPLPGYRPNGRTTRLV